MDFCPPGTAARMIRLFLVRLAGAIPVLLIVSVVSFGLMRLIPGDPAAAIAGVSASPAEIERLSSHPSRHRAGDSLSARNRFPGVVTSVEVDGVMALVEIEAGPHRVVAAITRDAVDELGLAPGVSASATVKATSVMVERT